MAKASAKSSTKLSAKPSAKNTVAKLTEGTVREAKNQSQSDLDYLSAINALWEKSQGDARSKLECFANFTSRQALTKFMARFEIFAEQLHVNGSIVEIGVHRGQSLMTWAHLSSILEPVNYTRKIIGFDTFSGFTDVNNKDGKGTSSVLKKGGFDAGKAAYDDLQKAVELFDANRLMNHIPKIELVKGDVAQSLPKYLKENPHLVVSLLHLDADLYAPTKKTLELLAPRMPKGAIIVFDELNMNLFPGETLATMETLGLENLRLQRFPYATSLSYAVVE